MSEKLVNKSIGGRLARADEIEAEALEFAAHLLVPTPILKKYVKRFRGVVTTAELAIIFGVTPDVLAYRMKQEKLKLW